MINIRLDIPTDALNGVTIDIEGILDESAAFLMSRIMQRFLSETDPEGRPWIPSRAGISRRAKGGGGTLFDTGRLFRSLQVYKTRAGERRIGTDVPYAPKHQKGLDGMVKRPFLGFSAGDETMVHQIVKLRLNDYIGT